MCDFFMLDGSIKTGNTFDGLYEVLQTVTAATAYRKVKMNNIAICLFKDPKANTDDDSLKCYYLLPDNRTFDEETDGSLSIPLSVLSKRAIISAIGKEMYEEMLKHGFCFMDQESGLIYFPSDGLELSLDARIGAHSDRFFVTNPITSIGHFLDIAAGFSKETECTLVVRSQDRVEKLMAVMTNKYAVIPLTYLSKIIGMIEKLDEVKCSSWVWTQRHTSVDLFLPNTDIARYYEENGIKKNITQGMQAVIRIQTGDCGDNALNVRAGFKKAGSNSLISLGEFNKKHMGEINEDKMLQEIEDSMLSEYYKLPDKLLELYDIKITGKDKFSNPVEDVYRNCLELLGCRKIIGTKRTKKLYEDLKIGINYAEEYNAYDVAMEFMSLPDRLSGLGKYYIEELERKIYQMIMNQQFWEVPELKLD